MSSIVFPRSIEGAGTERLGVVVEPAVADEAPVPRIGAVVLVVVSLFSPSLAAIKRLSRNRNKFLHNDAPDLSAFAASFAAPNAPAPNNGTTNS